MPVMGWLLNIVLLALWHAGYVIVRLLIVMRRFIPPGVLLIIVLVVPLLGFSLPNLDRVGSYMMVAAAVALAFVAGRLTRHR